MSQFRNKHTVLKELKEKYDIGEDNTRGGNRVMPFGRSLAITDLSKLTKLDANDVQNICDSLNQDSLIEKVKNENDSKSHFYMITEKGRVSVIDKELLNKIWYRKFDFWKFMLPFTIAVLGLLNSIFHWWG